ncbi:PAS domain S-box protein [Tumebacillus sp. DT12]|uniref:histidine kinase n=1 Tax=Tumebacillus lacus TaxID=2995335 RepID=A0ABT3WZR4_9BACL|nr:PAS domain-containing sensor histidine kinase [Tumebacillus lacus]MCX7569017.1 PAS domain S-box protein [Tumebacillus lacus]
MEKRRSFVYGVIHLLLLLTILYGYEKDLDGLMLIGGVTAVGLALMSAVVVQRVRVAEEELRATKEQLESFFDHTADAIGVFAPDGTLLRLNKASEQIFGYTVEEMTGRKVQTIPDESYITEVEMLQSRVRAGESVVGYETVRRHKDGTLIDVSITYSPIRDQQGNVVGFANILRDISERKRVERRLRESEERYRLITENTSDLISLVDPDGCIRYVSPSHETVLGYDLSYFQGLRSLELVHSEDVQLMKETWQQMILASLPVSSEFRYRHQNGEYVTLESRGMAVVREDGTMDSMVIVSRDVTERKRTEELLRNSEKQRVIGELAAGVAHEIRNPLTALRGFVQLFQQGSAGHPSYYQVMLDELDRINFIVSELLLLAKPQAVHLQERDLTVLLRNVLMLVDTQAIMNNVQILTEFEEGLPLIVCEENQLKQVFINLLKNAIEAMPEGGDVKVQVRRQDEDHLLIRVTDKGCGIPEDLIPRLGEPFYTTKEKGTGLGLMVSYKIIQYHQGEIEIESGPDGTTIDVILPVELTGAVAEIG